MIIKVKKLGLAAFIKTHSEDPNSDTKFLRYEDGHFIFESDKDLNTWKVQFMNDFVSRFDKNLMELREFLP